MLKQLWSQLNPPSGWASINLLRKRKWLKEWCCHRKILLCEHQPVLIKKIWAVVQQDKRRSVHDLQAVNVAKCAHRLSKYLVRFLVVSNYFSLEFWFKIQKVSTVGDQLKLFLLLELPSFFPPFFLFFSFVEVTVLGHVITAGGKVLSSKCTDAVHNIPNQTKKLLMSFFGELNPAECCRYWITPTPSWETVSRSSWWGSLIGHLKQRNIYQTERGSANCTNMRPVWLYRAVGRAGCDKLSLISPVCCLLEG